MSRKHKKSCCCEKKVCEPCCCEPCCDPCATANTGCTSAVAPIIFLLIACGSGLLNCGSSYLIILLFILFGDCFAGTPATNNCCC